MLLLQKGMIKSRGCLPNHMQQFQDNTHGCMAEYLFCIEDVTPSYVLETWAYLIWRIVKAAGAGSESLIDMSSSVEYLEARARICMKLRYQPSW